ncbi:hypothetical protein NPX13_g8174 [Xylaria arbuscula]|uniref:F-box domain-containing protein n=1 Tax=Xylaria arbuscula TaxID=114810 RepID=A0A9W8N9G6_9PEZI|nr:hypothetical protein NPX13_g8174 [Xylaria arbuscula]
MEQPPDQIQSELESFRQQWREEVSSRARNQPGPSSSSSAATSQRHNQQSRSTPGVASSSNSNRPSRRHEPPSYTKGPAPTSKAGQLDDDEADYVPAPVFDTSDPSAAKATGGHTLDGHGNERSKEPETALDFYEHAVERETTGKLGDSLRLYRKAFRMDDNVDRKYRDKHFAHRWTKAAQQQRSNPSELAVEVPTAAQPPQPEGGGGDAEEATPLSFPDLIASFAGLKVEGSPPECEGVEPPPCYIAALPDEILVHILRDVAVADVGDFVRLAQVCKRFAYLVLTEDRIWRRVCVGSEFGFGGMHYHFQQSITWKPLTLSDAIADLDYEADETDNGLVTIEQFNRRREDEAHATTLALYRGVKGYTTWQSMFQRRPRVRFNGCYISTVNYFRPGQNSGQTLTWNTPVHIVTYYRYLRLFRDGTVISLTTTDEPAHVVHQLTRDNLPPLRRGNDSSHHDKQQHHLPAPVMASALRGRWRLSSLRDYQDNAGDMSSTQRNAPPQLLVTNTTANQNNTTNPTLSSSEGDLYIETEGVVGAKYMYRMDLSLRSAGRSARNNKLVWRGFWSYNRLTDDWAQFALKNDKPFFFSRVRSYGVTGE